MPEVHSSASSLDASAVRNSRSAHPLRIALFGFGTVGSSVARILVESKPDGLELTYIFNRGVARKRVGWVPSSVVWSEDATVLASDVDVIVDSQVDSILPEPGCAALLKPARALSPPTKS